MVPLLLSGPLRAWAVSTQQTALDNAREAATELARRRVTRYEIERVMPPPPPTAGPRPADEERRKHH